YLNDIYTLSLHDALPIFSSIHMPYRKAEWIEKSSKDKENLLYYLPSTEKNYFIDSKQLISDNPEYSAKVFEGMFNLEENTTNWRSDEHTSELQSREHLVC